MKRCSKKCWIDNCQLAVDAINAEESLMLVDETFEELFKWYDARSAGWKKRANPKLWEETRRQWRLCVPSSKTPQVQEQIRNNLAAKVVPRPKV